MHKISAMPVFLLIGSFVLTVFLFKLSPARKRVHRQNHINESAPETWHLTPNTSYRLAFLKAALWHGFIIAVTTEWLSSDRALTRAGVISLWSGLTIVHGGLLGYALWVRSGECGVGSAEWGVGSAECGVRSGECGVGSAECGVGSAGLGVGGIAIVSLGISFVVGLCLLTALIVPTHNYDAMTYHLPRVMHWIQNQTVAHYPTHNLRQIAFSPGAAYILAHLQLLTGGDYAANCAQGMAYVGCIVGTSLIAQFSQNQRASQVATALVCASIPMAIMQASTSQTDLLVSFWLVCGAYFALKPARSSTDWGWLALAIGLAILTKPTGILFGVPLLMPIAYGCLRADDRSRLQAFLRALLIPGLVLLAGLSLSLPSYWRNLQTFGSPLGISGGTLNSVINLSVMFSNLLRNLALSLPLPPIWHWIQAIHTHTLKLDVSDPATTYSGNVFEIDQLWWRILLPEDENMVGNPVHLLLWMGVVVWMLVGWIVVVAGWRRSAIANPISPSIVRLTLCSLTGLLLMCALLKWQMWGNRLLLPFYVLNAPGIGCCLMSVPRQFYDRSHALATRGRLFMMGVLLTIALTYSIVPLYGFVTTLPTPLGLSSILGTNRLALYFRGAGPMLAAPYNALVQRAMAEKCATIGLELGGDDWEYPLWALLANLQANQGAVPPESSNGAHPEVMGLLPNVVNPPKSPFLRGTLNRLSPALVKGGRGDPPSVGCAYSDANLQIKHVNVNNPSRFLPEEFPDHKLCGIFKIQGLKSEYIQH